jgi:hypothetical protein
LNIRSVLRVTFIGGTLLVLGACSSPQPTSFGSTLGPGSGSKADPGAAGSHVSLASMGVVLGFESRDLSYCARERAPQYTVSTFLPEPKIDTSLSLDQISRLMKVDYRHMALGATMSREVVFALMSADVKPSPQGGVCAYPTRLSLTLGLTARIIHVASDFAGTEPCIFAEVLGHERHHVELDNSLMRAAGDSLRVDAAKRFADLYGVWGRDETAARQNLQHRLEADETQLRGEIQHTRVEAQAEEIDTSAERRRLVNACNGRLAQLYPGYM